MTPRFKILLVMGHAQMLQSLGWRRDGSVVITSVFGWRTFPDLRMIYG